MSAIIHAYLSSSICSCFLILRGVPASSPSSPGTEFWQLITTTTLDRKEPSPQYRLLNSNSLARDIQWSSSAVCCVTFLNLWLSDLGSLTLCRLVHPSPFSTISVSLLGEGSQVLDSLEERGRETEEQSWNFMERPGDLFPLKQFYLWPH